MFGLEAVGLGEQHPGEPAGGDVTAVGVRAALVDVLVQQVETAHEAEGLDLFEEVLDGDGGVVGPAFAQVLAVGIDEAGPVFGDAEHPLGLIGAGVAFDGVQGQLQTAGAFEQAHALVEQVVDLVPAFQGGLRAGPVIQGRVQHGGPAVAVCLHLAQGGFAQVVPQMPAICDLHRIGQGTADGLGVGRGAVTAHDLDARILAQPRFQGVGGAVGQHVDPLVGLGVAHHGGTAVPPALSEVVDADHAGCPPGGQRDAQQGAQGRVTRDAHSEDRQQT